MAGDLFWQASHICRIRTCFSNISLQDSAVFPAFVAYSIAHGRQDLFSRLVTEETMASESKLSLRNAIVGCGLFLMKLVLRFRVNPTFSLSLSSNSIAGLSTVPLLLVCFENWKGVKFLQ